MADLTHSNEPPHERAASPEDAFWTMLPDALIEVDDPWYVDIDAYVGQDHYGVKRSIERLFRPNPRARPYMHVGIIGAKGTGKTTQVRQAMAMLASDGVVVAYIDALAALDQSELVYADLLLVIAGAVSKLAEESRWSVPAQAYREVMAWFSEELLTESHRQELIGSVETTAELGGGWPALAKLMAKLSALVRSTNEYRTEIRRRVDRDPSELLRRVNQLLDAVTAAMPDEAKRLVVVFDNLEKLTDRALVERALLLRSDEIRQLRCSLLFFLDPSDEHAPRERRASDALTVVSVPMLPVRDKGDAWDHVGESVRELVRAMLARRADLEAVFADPDEAVRLLALHSGGRVRDLFHLAREACDHAQESRRVGAEHIRRACHSVAFARHSSVRPGGWARLAQISRDHRVVNTDEDHELILQSHVLEYNGEPWWDVHPLMRLDSRFQDALDGAANGHDDA